MLKCYQNIDITGSSVLQRRRLIRSNTVHWFGICPYAQAIQLYLEWEKGDKTINSINITILNYS